MKRLIGAALTVCVLFCLTACKPKEDNPTTIQAGTTSSSTTQTTVSSTAQPLIADISSTSDAHDMKNDRGNIVLHYDLQYPHIKNISDAACLNINNYFNDDRAGDLAVIDSMFEESRLNYENAKTSGTDLPLPYFYSKSYETMLNNGRFLSFSIHETVFTGGAHDLTTLFACTFNPEDGSILKLDDLFNVPQTQYLPRLYKAVTDKIDTLKEKSKPEDFLYFDSYADNVKVPDYNEKWFLSTNGIVLIYDTYMLAPYVAGSPVFEIEYSALGDILADNYE